MHLSKGKGALIRKEKKINVDIDFNVGLLVRTNLEKNIDDIVTIAFWSLYKMIILRNEKGKKKQGKKVVYFFLKKLRYVWTSTQLCQKKENRKCINYLN